MSFDSNPSGHLTTTRLEACINHVRNWMSSNRLKLNSDKTEFLVFGSHFRPWPLLSPIVIGNDSISPSDSTRNIYVIFDKHMYYEIQVSVICRTSFFLAWENSWHFTTPSTVSPQNDVWETSAEIPYWWRVTTQIWVVLLTGWNKFPTRNYQYTHKCYRWTSS